MNVSGERVAIDRVAHGGDGVGRSEDPRTWLVDGALPGEVVLAARTEEKPRMLRGRVVEVVEASAARQEAPCAIAGTCGGCGWQHVRPDAQAELKKEIVAGLLRRIEHPPIAVVASPAALGYRRRARLHFQHTRAGLVLGFVGRDGRSVIDAPDCVILDEPLRHAFARVRQLAKLLPAHGEIHGISDGARAVLGIASRGEVAGQRVPLPPLRGEAAAVRSRLQACLDEVLVGIVGPGVEVGTTALAIDGAGREDMSVRAGPSGGLRDMSVRAGAQGGREDMSVRAGPSGGLRDMSSRAGAQGGREDMSVRAGPFAFAQAQAAQNAALVAHVVAAAGPGHRRGLELFAGSGNFTRGLAPLCRTLEAIELDAGGAANLQQLAARLAVRGANVQVRREAAAATLARAGDRYDLVVLDPPRGGLGTRAAADLARIATGRVIYVSCDPATLARDLAALVGAGQRIASVTVFDMMPMTPEVEVVVVLSCGAPA